MMPAMRYSQGRHYLVAGPTSGVLVPDRLLAERAWPLVRDGSPMTEILAALLRDGLESLPDLAVYEFDAAGMRVILRGEMTATVESADGSAETSTGRARRTWLEHVFLAAVSGTVGESGEGDLPLQTGVTMAGGFTFSTTAVISETSTFPSSRTTNREVPKFTRRRPRREGSGQEVVSLFQRSVDDAPTRRSQ